jgi:hypothetical protein
MQLTDTRLKTLHCLKDLEPPELHLREKCVFAALYFLLGKEILDIRTLSELRDAIRTSLLPIDYFILSLCVTVINIKQLFKF